MKRIVAGALSAVMALTATLPAWADPGVRVYLRDADAAAGTPLKEVPGDHVTIGDFRNLTVTIDGAAPASTSMQLIDGQARALGAKSAVGLKMDQPVGVAITGGGEHFTISNDACTGRLLAAPGEVGSSCFVDVRPSATWWGPFTGSLRMSSGSYSQDVPLAGVGRHFDLPNLTIALVSGTPAALDITGQTVGDPRISAPATFRITNTSTEETTDALVTAIGGTNPSNFEFAGDACAGKMLGPGAACEVSVRAVSDRNANYTGTLTTTTHNKPVTALAGTSSGFLTVAWVASNWSSCSTSCGTGSQTRTVWCRRADGAPIDGRYCGWSSEPANSQGCTNTAACVYSWQADPWGECSRSCGGGTQSRNVWCQRSDGNSADAGFCGGGKPTSSQSCNTQACPPPPPTANLSVNYGRELWGGGWDPALAVYRWNTSNATNLSSWWVQSGPHCPGDWGPAGDWGIASENGDRSVWVGPYPGGCNWIVCIQASNSSGTATSCVDLHWQW